MAAGMDGYLTKPIRPHELNEVLDRYIASSISKVLPVTASEPRPEAICAEELLERVDGDLGFVAELLELLRGDYLDQIDEMRNATAANDCGRLQEVAHALKGALSNLAAPIAAGISGELEALGRRFEMGNARALVETLNEEMTRVVEELEELCMETIK